MTRSLTLSTALLGVGVALLVAPALFPVQPVLYHDTRPGTFANGSMLEAEGYEIVAYEDLSARGQELYVQTLRNDGEHIVPLGEGAREYAYPTDAELGEVRDYRERNTLQSIVIKRPPNASLPPPDERIEAAVHRLENEREREEAQREEREAATAGAGTPRDDTTTESGPDTATETGPTLEELRQQIGRYDQMTTRTDLPPTFAPPSLLRLLSVIAGILAIGTGGYLGSKP